MIGCMRIVAVRIMPVRIVAMCVVTVCVVAMCVVTVRVVTMRIVAMRWRIVMVAGVAMAVMAWGMRCRRTRERHGHSFRACQCMALAPFGKEQVHHVEAEQSDEAQRYPG